MDTSNLTLEQMLQLSRSGQLDKAGRDQLIGLAQAQPRGGAGLEPAGAGPYRNPQGPAAMGPSVQQSPGMLSMPGLDESASGMPAPPRPMPARPISPTPQPGSGGPMSLQEREAAIAAQGAPAGPQGPYADPRFAPMDLGPRMADQGPGRQPVIPGGTMDTPPVAPMADGGLGSMPAGPGALPAPEDFDGDELFRLDPSHSPTGQPRRAEIERNPDRYSMGTTRAGGEAPLPYSTPEERPAAGAPAAGAGLAMPTPATRQTGSSGRPSAATTVAAANEMNTVQKLAADWFGVDTPEERANAKTYLANWAAKMATSTAGWGSLAEANLAGIDGVKAEEMRQLGIDLKAEEAQMRREEVAYERTRDAIQDRRQAANDARDARNDDFEFAELQRQAQEAREARAREATDPFANTPLAGGPAEYEVELRRFISANPDMSPEQKEAWVQEQLALKYPKSVNPLAGLGL